MDPRVDQLLNEIVRLSQHLEREAQECQGYARGGDYTNTLRNLNDSRDELATLTQKWAQLAQLLQNR